MKFFFKIAVSIGSAMMLAAIPGTGFAQESVIVKDTAVLNPLQRKYKQSEIARAKEPQEIQYLFSVSKKIEKEPVDEYLRIGDKAVLIKEEQQRLREKGVFKIRGYVLFYQSGMVHVFSLVPPKTTP